MLTPTPNLLSYNRFPQGIYCYACNFFLRPLKLTVKFSIVLSIRFGLLIFPRVHYVTEQQVMWTRSTLNSNLRLWGLPHVSLVGPDWEGGRFNRWFGAAVLNTIPVTAVFTQRLIDTIREKSTWVIFSPLLFSYTLRQYCKISLHRSFEGTLSCSVIMK